MTEKRLPSFELVVATVDRTHELAAFFECLERQTYRNFRVLLVDQNPDDRLDALLASHPRLEIRRFSSQTGLSHARNVALEHVEGDIVGFPDDDCVYPDDLLERVARQFCEPGLDGLTGRATDPKGAMVGRWPMSARAVTVDNVWYCATSHTIFLRRELVRRVGHFDETLGLGSNALWSSGEEIDYLVRALRERSRIEYDPSVVITHPIKPPSPSELVALGRRDGASVGYILARNRYPLRTVMQMLVRPIGGALLELLRGDVNRARFHAATLGARIAGYRGGRGALPG